MIVEKAAYLNKTEKELLRSTSGFNSAFFETGLCKDDLAILRSELSERVLELEKEKNHIDEGLKCLDSIEAAL